MVSPLVRFAPSPTGHLHVGNMRTALVNYLFARAHQGRFMLRIDDTDDERSDAAYEASIRFDLKWMGMHWDCEDRQSSRLDHYHAGLERLLKSGRAYTCFETQEELSFKRKSQLS
ncbi:MAG: glutamate--tRNA ligase, partial [Alphaproteobacteria bacterium]|nr:glutamate--tRNA ligase [Alphaproteobacteria bacterium]